MTTKKDAKQAENALATAAAKAPKKKSAKTFIPGHETLVDQVIRRKMVCEQAKGLLDEVEQTIIIEATKIYAENAQKGQFAKSIDLAGDEFDGVNVSYSDSFGAIPMESAHTIIEAYKAVADGDTDEEREQNAVKMFQERFTEIRGIKLADTSDETIAILSRLLKFATLLTQDAANPTDMVDDFIRLRSDLRGSAKRGGKLDFGEIFEVVRGLSPASGMDKEQFGQPAAVRALLKQKKASVKVTAKTITKVATEEAMTELRARMAAITDEVE